MAAVQGEVKCACSSPTMDHKETTKALPLSSLNHISRTCSSLTKAKNFYKNLLGFAEVKRPQSFNFDGVWLFNYGVGIHLLQSESETSAQGKEIDPMSDHISFQCEDINMVEVKLQENGVKYLRGKVEEGGIWVDQLFFLDPDGFMIEVCNCNLLPVVPLQAGRPQSLTPQPQYFSPLPTAIPLMSIQ